MKSIKTVYEEVELEVMVFDSADVVRTSLGGEDDTEEIGV